MRYIDVVLDLLALVIVVIVCFAIAGFVLWLLFSLCTAKPILAIGFFTALLVFCAFHRVASS